MEPFNRLDPSTVVATRPASFNAGNVFTMLDNPPSTWHALPGTGRYPKRMKAQWLRIEYKQLRCEKLRCNLKMCMQG